MVHCLVLLECGALGPCWCTVVVVTAQTNLSTKLHLHLQGKRYQTTTASLKRVKTMARNEDLYSKIYKH